MLHVVSHGPADRSAVTLLHGFTQTGASWGPITDVLMSAGRRVLLVDAPGHGGSAGVIASMEETAELLAETLEHERVTGPIIGYSMGGRLALHLAVAHPEVVTALVLVSATAGIEDPDERAARRASDETLAASLERDGVEAFLARWLALPLFATLPPERAILDSRIANTPAGLAASLRAAGTGTQASLWDTLAPLAAVPVLLVAGALDAKYTAIAHRLAAAIGPSCAVLIMNGCGHACHLESPDLFTAALLAFLNRLPDRL